MRWYLGIALTRIVGISKMVKRCGRGCKPRSARVFWPLILLNNWNLNLTGFQNLSGFFLPLIFLILAFYLA